MPFNSSQHGPFTGGVDASSGAFVQPKGTVPRASNLINIAHGALCTCDGSSILAWENGAIQSGDHRIMALEVFQPSGVAPYYLMLKEGNDFPLDAPFDLGISGGTVLPSGNPASIVLTVGCGQSTIINSNFATQIQATVTDVFGNPVNPPVTVTFTVPVFGASGTWGGSTVVTAVTNSSGIATAPVLMANTTAGTFSVTATVSGLASGASCTLTNVNPASTVAITTTMLPGAIAGTYGEAYSATIEATGAGTWTVSGLPTDFTWSTVNNSGNTAISIVTGTIPVVADVGTHNITITVTPAGGTAASVTLPMTIVNSSIPAQPATMDVAAAPSGGDDTTALQNALNSAAAAGHGLHLTFTGSGTYKVMPLTIPANTYLNVDASVTVTDFAAYATGHPMITIASSNVVITGTSTAIFQTPLTKSSFAGTANQSNPVFRLDGASNVYLYRANGSQASGDGLYIRNSSNVVVVNCTFDSNYRQGCSLTDQVQHIFFEGCQFTNSSGTAPQSGVDIEPNSPSGGGPPVAQNYVTDVNFYTCNCNGNATDGFLVSLQNLNNTAPPVSIFVQNMHCNNNGGTAGLKYGFGYHLLNAGSGSTNPGGMIWIQNSFSSTSNSYGATARFWAANGAQITFFNLSVTNPNMGGADHDYGDKSAVTIIRGGGETTPMGNCRYGILLANNAIIGPTNITANVSTSPGYTDYYFNVQDGSGQTLQHITVELGTVTGANRPSGSNGLVNGASQNSVSIP